MKACLALVLASGLLAFGTGCQADWQGFFIHDNKRLGEAPSCEVPTEASATGLLAGRYAPERYREDGGTKSGGFSPRGARA